MVLPASTGVRCHQHGKQLLCTVRTYTGTSCADLSFVSHSAARRAQASGCNPIVSSAMLAEAMWSHLFIEQPWDQQCSTHQWCIIIARHRGCQRPCTDCQAVCAAAQVTLLRQEGRRVPCWRPQRQGQQQRPQAPPLQPLRAPVACMMAQARTRHAMGAASVMPGTSAQDLKAPVVQQQPQAPRL